MVIAIRNLQPLVPSFKYAVNTCTVAQRSINMQINIVRNYAKGKDKNKEKGRNKGGRSNIQLNDEELQSIIDVNTYRIKLEEVLNAMKTDYIETLTIRSSSGAVDNIKVKVNGKQHELQEIAQISRKGGKTIALNLIEFPGAIPAVLKAIKSSGMNLNPQQDGTMIFIPVPKVTKEHREFLAKNAKALFHKYRDELKDVQNNAIKRVKKNTDISEDIIRSVQMQLTTEANDFVGRAEKLLKAKEHELLYHTKL